MGVLDTGADDLVFPADMAAQIGIDLSQGVVGRAQTSTGASMEFRYREVWLQIEDTATGYVMEWSAVAAFSSDRRGIPILGHAGFLEYFDATFYGAAKYANLTANAAAANAEHSPTPLA